MTLPANPSEGSAGSDNHFFAYRRLDSVAMGIRFALQLGAGRRDSRASGAGWIVIATFLALLALTAALIAAFRNSTDIADELARNDERHLVTHYLERQASQIVATERVQLIWDDAMRHAVLGIDPVWTDKYFGEFFWSNFRTDRLYLVRPDGSLVRAWSQGKLAGQETYSPIHGLVAKLIDKSERDQSVYGDVASFRQLEDTTWPYDSGGQPLPRWSGTIIDYNGRPAFLAVASIVPDNEYALLRRKPNHIASIRLIDERIIQQLSSSLMLADVRFAKVLPSDSGRNAVALQGQTGQQLGWLHWRAKLPGPAILRRTAPLLATYILFFIGVVIGGAIIVRRMRRTTSELLASEAQAQHNALHDAMSGLPNRTHFMQRLRNELALCADQRVGGDVFVAYVDIDRFKVVNDTLGHHVGDELVRQVAGRLRRSLPGGDFLSRFGGDEFVLMRRSVGGKAAADVLGNQVMALMREPFVISGNNLDVTCSCGISWGPEQSEDPGELLRRADIALYRAKQRGRARYRRFTRDMDASVRLRQEMEMELRRAIARDELAMAYQPIVAAGDGAIQGFEALLRWPHPERGNIRPGLFVPVAEQAGLMVPLGTWVLRRVFTQCRDWPDCDISVNLSPLQIMASDFLRTMDGLIVETGIDPRRIVLEVTEGVMLDRSEHVLEVLRGLDAMGFRIALDDFGIGYSSLSYLRSFQFDRIKVDRSFVQNIEGDLDAHSILRAIVSLGHTLRMKVVAEGVETQVQRQLVQAAGCQMVQGHLFWAALSPDEALALLPARREHAVLRKVG